MNKEIISNCCGAAPWSELDGPYGICGDCKEHCEFEMSRQFGDSESFDETTDVPKPIILFPCEK